MSIPPIIMSAVSIKALLAGTKTQTRRLLSPSNCTVLGSRVRGRKDPRWAGLDFARAEHRTQSTLMRAVCGADAPHDLHLDVPWKHPDDDEDDGCVYRVRPVYEPGDLLWVKEEWRPVHSGDPSRGARYRADVERDQTLWKSPRFMPRWASRLTLEVTDVRVQRLQEISTDDCLAEGIEANEAGLVLVDGRPPLTAKAAYRDLWTRLHGPDAWDANPEVVALTFKVHQANVAEIIRAA